MDILEYMRSMVDEDRDGVTPEVEVSYSTLSLNTGYSLRQVRTRLKSLIEDGLVIPVKSYTNGGSFRYLLPEVDGSSQVQSWVVAVIYCKMVSRRTGQTFNPRYKFLSYGKTFRRIATMCAAEKMNLHIYIAACFESFPEHWCQLKFKSKYPFPPLLVPIDKHRARERYETFLRVLSQYSPAEKQDALTLEQKLENSIYVWKRVNRGFDITNAENFYKLGLISYLFYICLPGQPIDFVVKEAVDHKITPQIIKRAREIIRREIDEPD